MPEPTVKEVKDSDGYTWIRDPRGGWSLKNHDQLCYLNQPWTKIDREYGPMRILVA